MKLSDDKKQEIATNLSHVEQEYVQMINDDYLEPYRLMADYIAEMLIEYYSEGYKDGSQIA